MGFQLRRIDSQSRTTSGSLTYTVPTGYRVTIKELLCTQLVGAANINSYAALTITSNAIARIVGQFAVPGIASSTTWLSAANSANSGNITNNGSAALGSGLTGVFFVMPIRDKVLEAGDTIVLACTKDSLGTATWTMEISGVLEVL